MSEGARANVSWSHDKLMDGVSTYTPEIDGHVTRALCRASHTTDSHAQAEEEGARPGVTREPTGRHAAAGGLGRVPLPALE